MSINQGHNIFSLFERFEGREQALREIKRFHIHPTMFYRSSLWTHSKHLVWIMKAMAPHIKEVFGESFNQAKAEIMGCIHDDFEIVMGDVQAGQKKKMDNKQLDQLDLQEKKAIEEISRRFPENIGPYNYKDLLNSIQQADSLEAQVIKFADKIDAFGESLHEIYGGNYKFMQSISDPIYGDIPAPLDYYVSFITSFPKQFPQIAKLFEQEFSLFEKPVKMNFVKIAKKRNPHTKESLKIDTGYTHYDAWMKIMLEYADDEELQNLYTQKEFLTK
ncbi:YfbR-like 5'-deoxynucleotidase [Patescibacteria group bacterium]